MREAIRRPLFLALHLSIIKELRSPLLFHPSVFIMYIKNIDDTYETAHQSTERHAQSTIVLIPPFFGY